LVKINLIFNSVRPHFSLLSHGGGSSVQLNPELLESESERLAHELSGSGVKLDEVDDDTLREMGYSLEDVQNLKDAVFIGRKHFVPQNWEYGIFSVRKLIFPF